MKRETILLFIIGLLIGWILTYDKIPPKIVYEERTAIPDSSKPRVPTEGREFGIGILPECDSSTMHIFSMYAYGVPKNKWVSMQLEMGEPGSEYFVSSHILIPPERNTLQADDIVIATKNDTLTSPSQP